MEGKSKFLAADLGAGSGRVMLGTLEKDKLKLEEIHRFTNEPVIIHNNFYWDTLRLFHEIKTGIIKAKNTGHKDALSIAIDTWGVDYGLIDKAGNPAWNNYNYRDARTDDIMDKVFAIMPAEEIYKKTGIQFMQLNTIFQLFAEKQNSPEKLKQSCKFLLTPDLINFFLTGKYKAEYTIASTTQLLNAETKQWDCDIISALDLPLEIFPEIAETATVLGEITDDLKKETGLNKLKVVHTAGHDTQAAITAIPADTEEFLFLSSGTWSLLGTEIDKPILTEKARKYNFTNEGGANGKINFMSNILGLWLLQECKRHWEKEGKNYTFDEMEENCLAAQQFKSLIDINHHLFIQPGNMPEKIRQFCKETNQPIPENDGEITRTILESLAFKYKQSIENIEEITGKTYSELHVFGGGIKNEVLNNFTASATGKKVITGPVEATATGNILLQAVALGIIKDVKEARKIVKNSFTINEILPADCESWKQGYLKYLKISDKVKQSTF